MMPILARLQAMYDNLCGHIRENQVIAILLEAAYKGSIRFYGQRKIEVSHHFTGYSCRIDVELTDIGLDLYHGYLYKCGSPTVSARAVIRDMEYWIIDAIIYSRSGNKRLKK